MTDKKRQSNNFVSSLREYLPGLILVLVISVLATFINDLMKDKINLEALTIAILLGMILGNTVGVKEEFKSGTKFSLKKLLKVGIVLLGFKLNFMTVINLGPKILIMVICYIPITLLLAVLLGRIFKVNKRLATLIGVGSSICGASAVVALAPCVGAEEEDSIVAVSIVSLLGALGVMIYSAVAVNFQIEPTQYGVWSGISLHGVAHALAAAFAMGDGAGEIGTIVKMTRVLMLVPVSLVLAFLFNKDSDGAKGKKAGFPMYVLYFVIAGVINSTGIIPPEVTKILVKLSSWLILMSMTAMGLSVDFKSIMKKGKQGFSIATILFMIMSTLSFFVVMKFI